MCSRNRYCLIALVVFFCVAPQLQAADLTFFVGGVKPGTISYKNVKTSLDSSPIYGFRLGMGFVPFFGMEHTMAFSSDYLFPQNTSIKDSKGFVYNSNLILSVPAGSLVPYVTAGVGLLHQYGDSDMPVGTRFAFNYGGGVKLPRMIGPLGLRVDLRGYRAGVLSNKVNLFEASGGVLISLGK